MGRRELEVDTKCVDVHVVSMVDMVEKRKRSDVDENFIFWVCDDV